MKNTKAGILIIVACFFIFPAVSAQKFSHADKYVDFIVKQQSTITKRFFDYTKAISLVAIKSPKKNTQLFIKLINELKQAKANVDSMPSFKGDSAYKKSTLLYVTQFAGLADDDYKKIGEMKGVANEAYDNMQAFLSAKESAGKKAKGLNEQLYMATTKFAATYKVSIPKYSIGEKMDEAVETEKYYKPVYLIFFKSYIAEANLQNAIDRKDDNDFKKHIKDLLKISEDCGKELDTVKSYKNDNSLVDGCKEMLEFYEKEASEKTDPVSDYFLASKDFDAARSLFEKKTGHSGPEVKAYKKQVKEYNKALAKYNNAVSKLYTKKKSLLKKWNGTVNKFINKYMPAL